MLMNDLGLALSGGVDSMALATLCRGLQCEARVRKQFEFSFEAFIVDHRARKGSSEETQVVSTRVSKLLGLQGARRRSQSWAHIL